MNFDRISKRFAERRLTRRQALASGGASLVAGLTAAGFAQATAQTSTPEVVEVEPWDGEKTTYLFVQSFHAGSIVPTEGAEGRYTVTLEQGTGQTIYFGDRPSRDVGTTDTTQFLEGLGFSEANPPNAAMILETSPGESDVAVVELYNPTIAPDTGTVTYDVEVLENWRQDLELGLQEDPTDLATLAPEFGAAHLLIDDCPADSYVDCAVTVGFMQFEKKGVFYQVDYCWNFGVCMPCEPYGHDQPDRCTTPNYWRDKCNTTFPDCQGRCYAWYAWPAADFGCN